MMDAKAAAIPLDPPEGHGYAMAKIKTFRGMDGQGLNATLTRGGKAVALLLDEGCGGMMHFDWLDRSRGESSEEAMFLAFIEETVPPDPEDKGSSLDPRTLKQFAAEQWVNAEVDRIENDKRFRRACKTKTLFQVGEKIGGDEFLVIKGVGPHLREILEKKYAGKKVRVLNDEFK